MHLLRGISASCGWGAGRGRDWGGLGISSTVTHFSRPLLPALSLLPDLGLNQRRKTCQVLASLLSLPWKPRLPLQRLCPGLCSCAWASGDTLGWGGKSTWPQVIPYHVHSQRGFHKGKDPESKTLRSIPLQLWIHSPGSGSGSSRWHSWSKRRGRGVCLRSLAKGFRV